MSNPALTYEETVVPMLFAPWAELVVRAADPRPGERVLDAACGTGIVARRVAPEVGAQGEVIGLDMSPAMLEVARTLGQRAGLPIRWQEARLEALPFTDRRFDVVICQHGLQFVPEKRRAVAEMVRVLSGQGRAVISVWQDLEHHPFHAAVNEMLERRIGLPALAAPFTLGDADELYALLSDAGLSDVTIEVRSIETREARADYARMLIDAVSAAIPAAQHLDDDARAGLTRELGLEMEPLLDEWTQGQDVVVPFHGHIARGTRRLS